MADFRSFKTARREQAAPMKPLVDPAGWTANDLRDVSRWSYRINARDADELADGGRGGAPQGRRHGRHPQGGFPAQGLRRRARSTCAAS